MKKQKKEFKIGQLVKIDQPLAGAYDGFSELGIIASTISYDDLFQCYFYDVYLLTTKRIYTFEPHYMKRL
jgi:hypothetical protein